MSEMNKAEALDAEVIDGDIMISDKTFEIDMSGIQRDVEDLTAAIDDALTVYGEMLVEPADVESMSYADVRRCEREVSSAIRAADELRRKLNRDYKVPLDVAKRRYDELMGPVIALHGLYRERRIAFDEAAKEGKRREIARRYEEMAPYLALPLDGQDEPLVPFGRIFDRFGSKWLNKGTALQNIETELVFIVQRIAEGEARLDGMELAHATEAKAVYWQTLDYDAAVARDAELCQAQRRQEALAAERAERERLQAAKEPAAAVDRASGGDAVAEPATRKPRVMMIDGATDDECRQIGAFCRSLGITGVFKGERFYEKVKSLGM